ncbi:MAG: hypothetical protein NZO16_00415 [Deltaproteobacteria bacterium]|nr:hypothetical protein [Deltaproteobacteria bacterium]
MTKPDATNYGDKRMGVGKSGLSREQAEQIYTMLKKRVDTIIQSTQDVSGSQFDGQKSGFIMESDKIDSSRSWSFSVYVYFGLFLLVSGIAGLIYYETDNIIGFVKKTTGRFTQRASLTLSESTHHKLESDGLEELALQLEAKRINLEQKENELKAKQGELKFLELALNEKIAELKAHINRIKQLQNEVPSSEKSRIEMLVNLVLSMPAKEAANLLQGLDNDVIVEILSKMPERRSGAILNFFNRDRAVRVAKLLSQPELKE